MTTRERAAEWILARCGNAGQPASFSFDRSDLPCGLDKDDVKGAFKALKQAGRITGNIVTTQHNTKCQVIELGSDPHTEPS